MHIHVIQFISRKMSVCHKRISCSYEFFIPLQIKLKQICTQGQNKRNSNQTLHIMYFIYNSLFLFLTNYANRKYKIVHTSHIMYKVDILSNYVEIIYIAFLQTSCFIIFTKSIKMCKIWELIHIIITITKYGVPCINTLTETFRGNICVSRSDF